MKFWKIALVFLLPFTIYLLPPTAYAQSEFSVSSDVTYRVQDNGKTEVIHDITLGNNFSTLYATTYTLSLENIDAQDIVAKDDKGKTLEVENTKDGDKQKIKIIFADAVVGKDSKRHFTVSYENGSFAVRTGEVWEVSIPRLSDENSFKSYSVTLEVPPSLGLEAYVSPTPTSFSESGGKKVYKFTKAEVIQTGITAGFGEFQVFSFNLSYHLENPLNRTSSTEISLPPDTAFQKVYFSKIEPAPANVKIDADGNWLAEYKLTARQRIDINVSGSVQIFASHRPFPKPTAEVLSTNLQETPVWQVNDPEIKVLANELKTPRAIYDYVTTTLKYDFSRVRPNVERFGAKKALQNPTQAICMEFTDLFIALARAAGIPAREINGYAYTENPELQPLSLVADVLHAWPEYYDKDRGVWIPVDPTWGSTTGGEDFFSKLDLRHFAFVIHGASYLTPYAPGSYKLGPNPQKDVFVSFGKLPQNRLSTPVITLTSKKLIPFLVSSYFIKIANPGPASLYSLYPTVYFDSDFKNRDFIALLPPYSNYQMEIKVPFSLLGKDTPNIVKIVAESATLEVPTNKTHVVINSMVVLFVIFFALIIAVLLKLKKITFKPIADKIRYIYGKLIKRPEQNPPPQDGKTSP